MNSLSERVQRIKPSATLAISAKATELKAAGHNIIDLGAGEPDFDTPDFIKKAAIEAINDGFTKYTAVDGIPKLRQAISDKFKRDNGLDYGISQILVSCGGKQSFFNLTQALLNSGDEVIIPSPYWVSYPDMVLLADASPVIIKTEIDQGFKLTPQQLEQAITSKTRLLVLNSPSNPTGAVYTSAELQALAQIVLKHPQLMVVTDDIYEHISLDDSPFHNILTVCNDLKDQSIVLNGVSKAYSMTGWRIGYAGGPEWLIKGMKKIQSQSTSNPASISQMAALAALNGDQSCIKPMVDAFKERHQFIIKALNSLEGIRCIPSAGAFYSFPDCSETIKRLGLADDVEFADFLMSKAGVAVVPGSAFGNPGCIRISFATSMNNLQDAVERMRKVL